MSCFGRAARSSYEPMQDLTFLYCTAKYWTDKQHDSYTNHIIMKANHNIYENIMLFSYKARLLESEH